MSYEIPTSAGKRRDVMVEFMPSVPRLALFRNWTSMPIEAQLDQLAEPAYNPRQQVLVDHQAGFGSVREIRLWKQLSQRKSRVLELG